MESALFLCSLLFSSMFFSINGFALKCSDSTFQESILPNFQLSCKENKTVIHFPNYGELVVKSIDYKIKKLNLLDPRNCVHEVFLNLDLSLTPFQYYYVVKNYTYLNCSTRISSDSFVQIPCLSGSDFHVYTVDQSILPFLPVSCAAVKTVAIPFSYSPYLADNSFGLALTWRNSPDYQEDNWITVGDIFRCLKFVVFILVVAKVVDIKMNYSKKLENGNLNEVLVCCKTQDNKQLLSTEEERV